MQRLPSKGAMNCLYGPIQHAFRRSLIVEQCPCRCSGICAGISQHLVILIQALHNIQCFLQSIQNGGSRHAAVRSGHKVPVKMFSLMKCVLRPDAEMLSVSAVQALLAIPSEKSADFRFFHAARSRRYGRRRNR